MKSVLISIQPYWVFLIIARLMGWDIPQEKTIEVRKDFPKDRKWNKTAHIYCSKDKKSFNRIPKQYQPLMAKFLGKVLGKFVCDRVYDITAIDALPFGGALDYAFEFAFEETCLTAGELDCYLYGNDGYGWHISDLKIYDKPKELWEFKYPCPVKFANYDCSWGFEECKYKVPDRVPYECDAGLTRPPQSWCYIEEL